MKFLGSKIECDACGIQIANLGLGSRTSGLVVQLNGFRKRGGGREEILLLKRYEDEGRASLFACGTRATMVGRRGRRLL